MSKWELLKELYVLTTDAEIREEEREAAKVGGMDVADVRMLIDRHTRRVLERLTPMLDAAVKNAEAFVALMDREIPCGHSVADLIRGAADVDDAHPVTKCGACLAERQKKREEAFRAGWRRCVYGRPGKERGHVWHVDGPTNAPRPGIGEVIPALACSAHRRRS